MATPIANDDLDYTINEDSILRVNPASGVLGNDTDTDNDALAAEVVTNPKNPLFDIKTNGSFTYDARYHGQLWLTETEPDVYVLADSDGGAADLPNGFDSLAAGATVYDEFTYAAGDGQDNDTATARVAITGVNDAPVADDDAGTFQQGVDTSISIDALAGDTDVDVWPAPDVLTITGLSDLVDDTTGPTDSDNSLGDGLSITTLEGGTATLNNDGTIAYTAAPGFFGIDTIEYTVSDGKGGTDTGMIRITVLPANESPVANDDTRSVSEDAGVTSFVSVLGNDTDADDAPLIAADLDDPLISALRRVDDQGNTITGNTGVLVDFNSDGTFDYDPNGEFESLGVGDTAYVAFDYTAYDGHGAADGATVTLQVQGENDNPTGESPDPVKVYEAGLTTGSQDHRDENGNLIAAIPIVQDIDITISDVDASDTPFVAGTTGGDTTTLTGTYGTLEFLDDDTVRYTLNTNADHAALEGHNGGIVDDFTVYVVDEHGGYSDPLTVSVEVIDDVNFLAVQPVDGDGNPIGTLDTLDDKDVAFADGASATDSFTLVPGADGQTLDVVGIPNEFQLVDGRTVTSAVYTDINGNEAVRGTDSEGDTFYEIEFDPDPDSDASSLLGAYTLTMFQNPPVVINDLDFSALTAGGPQESVTVENITFDGGFFTDRTDLFGTFDDEGIPNNSDDFINPNNAGGIGIGNGNIERYEVLEIDVTGSIGNVSGVEMDVQGVGGGIKLADVLWEAVEDTNGNGVADEGDTVVASGTVSEDVNGMTLDFSAKDPYTIRIEPGMEFDFLFTALDPDDIDSNDKVRINRIATLEQEANEDIVLGFRLNSDDGDGDHSPTASGYEEFYVTVQGDNGGQIDPGIVEIA